MDKTTNTFAARLFVKIAGLFCGRINFNECWGDFLKKVRLTSFQIIILGFLFLILLGTLLLMLPISQANGNATSFKDALFTSTSATCVTGLVVKNTATYWSLFGKCVILCLIQIGGLGIVTVAMAFSLLGRKKIGLMQRTVMQESISAFYVGGIVKFTSFIIRTVICCELLGALLMLPVFWHQFGGIHGIFYAVFHSISAFCNAGFDLLGRPHPYASLTGYVDNLPINIVIMSLILIGGLGFRTWEDVRQNKHHFSRYCLQSKLVLAATAVLIIIPFLYFFFAEFGHYPLKERILAALFTTVSPRTAGFNTVDLNRLSDDGIVMNIMLMLIGGATGSTAGGMKLTTVAVLAISAHSVLHRKKDATAFGRRIGTGVIFDAAAIFSLYFGTCVISAMAISAIEGLPFLKCMFETSSAVATVGLTLGITPHLSTLSQLILIVLMFMGRVGGMTLVFATIARRHVVDPLKPEEKVQVG